VTLLPNSSIAVTSERTLIVHWKKFTSRKASPSSILSRAEDANAFYRAILLAIDIYSSYVGK
jgi:hypothetical protein